MKIQELKNSITKEEEEVVLVLVEEVIIIVLLTERLFALNFLASHNLERKRRRGSTRRSQSRQSLWYCADEGRCRDGAQGSRHDCCLRLSVCVCALCLFAFAHCALSACAALLSLGGQQSKLAKQFFRHLEWRLMTAHLWEVNERPCFIPGLYLKSLTMTTGFRPSCGQL